MLPNHFPKIIIRSDIDSTLNSDQGVIAMKTAFKFNRISIYSSSHYVHILLILNKKWPNGLNSHVSTITHTQTFQ